MKNCLDKNYPCYLPFQLSSFVGRADELAHIEPLVLRHRLVTLTGAGGVGKSRLAFEVASRLASEFPDGIWPVEFASLADPALIPRTVAHVLGVPEQADEPLLQKLTEHLGAHELLLILDNCEHLLSGCAALVETLLLRGSFDLRLLVTSRQPLGVPGEVVWRVPPLAVPEDGTGHAPRIHPPDIAGCDAVQLFVQRAQAALPDFALAEDNAGTVAEICRRLDGLPLALELAAARSKVLTPEQIAERLKAGLSLLKDGAPAGRHRHHTMMAAIDWSYRLLAERERCVLRRLSVFQGGWTLEAAAAVCESTPEPADEIIDLLSCLVDKSLVVAQPAGREMRFRLLETIRVYAAERLHEAGEDELARRLHLAYYLALAEQAALQLRRADHLAWLARLDAEHDNLRAALRCALSAPETSAERAEQALRLVNALEPYWHIRGHYREGWSWAEKALALPHGAGTALRAQALCAAGNLAFTHEAGEAIGLQYTEESVAAWRALGPGQERGLAHALWTRAMQVRTTWWPEAEICALAEESLAVARSCDDASGAADALYVLGRTWLDDDMEHARHVLEESLAIYEREGDVMGASRSRSWLGLIACHQDDYATGLAYLARWLEDARSQGNPLIITQALWFLGASYLRAGDIAAATSHYRQALELAQRSNLCPMRLMWGLGLCLVAQGDDRGAAAIYAALKAGAEPEPDECRFGFLAIWGQLPTLIKCARRQHRQAALLLGVAQAACERYEIPMDRDIRAQWDRTVDVVRAHLDPAVFDTACAEGGRLTADEAMALTADLAHEAEPDASRILTPLQAAKHQCGGLTAREREVAGSVAHGFSNSQIADRLCVSERTVEAHMGNILSKLQFSSRTQVATWALQKGLLTTAIEQKN